jgi:autotransporter translocation and assembly factor TamB
VLWQHRREPASKNWSSPHKEEMMNQRKWLAVAVVIVALVAVLASLTAPPAPAQPRTFVWKVQSSFPVTDYPHRSLVEIARSID